MSFVKTMKNIFFLFHASWIILSEFVLYWTFNDYMSFIDRLTSKLASINILYVKIFQAFALNNKLIDEQLNNYLLKYTDNAPWSSSDIDDNTLYKLDEEYPISFETYGFVPLNSGMISLVFKAKNTLTKEHVIIKLKRKNINATLDEAIEKLLFFVYIMSFIPLFENYKIPDLIYKNISIIQQQTDFKQ